MDERVMNQTGIEGVWRVENPIGIGWEAEHGKILLMVELIHELQREAGLRELGRAGTARMKTTAGREGRLAPERGLAIDRFVERELHGGRTQRCRSILTKRIHHQDRQGR